MQLGELLQWLSLGSKTGTLLIDGHGVEKRIYFQDGRIASTSSSDQREYLGPLPRLPRVHHRGGAQDGHGGPGGVADPPRQDPRHDQRHRRVRPARASCGRRPRSRSTTSSSGPRATSSSSTGEHARPEDGPPLARRHRHHHGGHAPLRRVAAHPPAGSRLVASSRRSSGRSTWSSVADREKLIVPYIDGQRTIEEIALQTHNAEFTVSKLISEGLRTGTMRLTESRPAATRRRRSAPGSREVDHFLQRGRAAAQGRPPGRLPHVQGRPRARPERRPRDRGPARGRARHQDRPRARTASPGKRSRSSPSRCRP